MWLPSLFKDCPFCKAYNSYGITVHKPKFGVPSLIELCKACRHSATRSLPLFDKKIIYLDQFFISDVSKESNQSHVLFFKRAYEQLCNLFRLQLIICPYSSFHKTESLSDTHSNKLQKVYEHLSNANFIL